MIFEIRVAQAIRAHIEQRDNGPAGGQPYTGVRDRRHRVCPELFTRSGVGLPWATPRGAAGNGRERAMNRTIVAARWRARLLPKMRLSQRRRTNIGSGIARP